MLPAHPGPGQGQGQGLCSRRKEAPGVSPTGGDENSPSVLLFQPHPLPRCGHCGCPSDWPAALWPTTAGKCQMEPPARLARSQGRELGLDGPGCVTTSSRWHRLRPRRHLPRLCILVPWTRRGRTEHPGTAPRLTCALTAGPLLSGWDAPGRKCPRWCLILTPPRPTLRLRQREEECSPPRPRPRGTPWGP